MAVRRVLIVMDDDSEAQLLVCDHTQDCDNNYLSSQIIEVVMGRGARFDLYDMEESSAKPHATHSSSPVRSAGSSLLVNGITLIGGVTRKRLQHRCHGRTQRNPARRNGHWHRTPAHRQQFKRQPLGRALSQPSAVQVCPRRGVDRSIRGRNNGKSPRQDLTSKPIRATRTCWLRPRRACTPSRSCSSTATT